MTIIYTTLAILVVIALGTLVLLPRKVVVTRKAEVSMAPAEIIARVGSNRGFSDLQPLLHHRPKLEDHALWSCFGSRCRVSL